ncbi:Hsp70 protein that interacts with Zuo1p [Coemansia erecta]|uniref:Hsp70 protein that interacts with Zuo1p n=1 Tax=Coemansia erecta TaxID=147472 RepID=A0A9W7Y8K4_9FUNG|nr:Hsp70 protein that interacts with Zuo1p [Coemansia erecta]
MSAAAKTYIGLSLGNHNSVIAIINKDHRAEVIANEDGEHKTPTYVAFSGEEEYHGSQAKHQFVRNAQNTIMGFRDLLGKPYSADMNALHEGFAKIVDQEGKPVFVVHTEDDDGNTSELQLSAHEVTVRYLARLRTTAEDYLGRKIDGAVMALPVWFTAEQKKSVAAACEEAGIPLLQLVSEPVAAAVQYGVGKDASHEDAKDALALVVDVGGTGSDVALVASRGGLYSVVASKHTVDLSGDIVDDVLVKHFAAEFQRQNKIDVLQGNAKAVRKLKQAVETTKRTLSSATTAPCAVESLAEGIDFNGAINRTRFDIMSGKVYGPLLDVISSVIADAGYTTAQVDQVLLCGGASRIRRLQSRIAGLFPETTEVREDAGELDEIIAAGCAEQAALIAQGIVEAPEDAANAADLVVDMLAKPVGLQISADELVAILHKDTPLPASRSVKVALPAGQKRAYVAVAEGEPVPPKEEDEEEDEEDEDAEPKEAEVAPLYRPSKLLAEMVLELEDADENTRVEITFFVGTDKKLTVTATEHVSGKSITAEIPQ